MAGMVQIRTQAYTKGRKYLDFRRDRRPLGETPRRSERDDSYTGALVSAGTTGDLRE
jgi:hypothetical protein